MQYETTIYRIDSIFSCNVSIKVKIDEMQTIIFNNDSLSKITSTNGSMYWTKNDFLHRLDHPAMITNTKVNYHQHKADDFLTL